MRLVTVRSRFFDPPQRAVARHRRRGRAAALVAVALLSTSVGSVQASKPPRHAAADPKVIGDWNAIAFDTIVVDSGKANAEAFMWFAFEQAAVYNAVVGITRRYELYNWDARGPHGASPQAAAAVAAHDVLLEYFPASQSRLDTALAASLAEIPDGPKKKQGIHYGKRAADRLIELREDDGRFAPVTLDVPPAPGVWRPTPNPTPPPPAFAPFFDPWLAQLRPLLLDSPDHTSGLTTIVGAVTRALSGTLGLGGDRIDLNITVSGTTRHYEFASQLNRDAVDARVWSGIHFRTADVVGNATGTQVGDWALDNYFQPTQ